MKLSFPFLSIALLVAINVSGQNSVQIKGKLKPPMENTTISVNKPVAGMFNMVLPDPGNDVTTTDGSFKIDVLTDAAGFIRLQGKGLPKTYFYAEPGGKIEATFTKEQTGRITVTYSGANADANKLLATVPPMDNQNFLQFRLPEIFKSSTAEQLMSSLKQDLAKETRPLEAMLRKRKITQQCYDAMMREAEQTIVHWINIYMKNFQMNDNELSQVCRLSRDEVNKLGSILYTEFDPYNSRYKVATRTYNNQMIKSMLIEDGLLPGRKDVTSMWGPFADDFKMIISRLSAIDHAPDSVQMTFMGMSLVSALAFKPMTDEAFLRVFNTYYSKFPRSPFIPVITKEINLQSAEEKSAASVTDDVHFLLNKPDSVQLQNSRIVTVKTIQELIKTQFPGKTVFVDFWATWCSPCIAEFQHEHELRDFLQKNNIVTLYVSIDSENAIRKWQKAISRYQLAGYHYLVNDDVRNSIEQIFFGIPRYMLFDSKGELKDKDLPKPGTKTELYQRITDLLNN